MTLDDQDRTVDRVLLGVGDDVGDLFAGAGIGIGLNLGEEAAFGGTLTQV